MEKGKVVIIVLNYNGEKCLKETLTSLEDISYPNYQVLVVDNNSTDGSFEQAKKDFPQYSFLNLAENGGFARGMNSGMKWALHEKAEYVWLFNYDAIAERNTLTELVKEATQGNNKVLLSPLILDQNGKRWFSGGRINFFRMRVEHDRGLVPKQATETHFLTGCALFLPKKVIEVTGFLDENFFLYYEDADYSLRAQQYGIALKVVPRARVIHSEQSQFSQSKIYHLVISGLIFFEKHNKNPLFSFYQAIYVILRRLKNYTDVARRRPNALFVLKAYQDFYARKKSNNFSHLR